MAQSNTIQYGTFVFPYVSLTANAQAVYAGDGMTQEATRYTFNVSGVITGTSLTDFNNTLTQMKCQLAKPRLQFGVSWTDNAGTQSLYSFDGVSDDVEWGPKPGELELTKFSGGLAATYKWSLVVVTKQCFGDSCSPIATRPTDVLSIIYEFAHSIDPNGYTTRTVTGKLVVAASSVQDNVSADHFRYVIAKAVQQPKWFKRERQEYHQSTDGRILSFTIVDIEQQWTLPTPITSGNVSWSSRLSGIMSKQGMQVDYTLSGYFETSAAHGKSEILAAIHALAAQRFGAIKGTTISGEREIRESVYGNRIDFHLTAIGYAGNLPNGLPDYNMGLDTIGSQPVGSDGSAILMNPYGQTDSLNSGVIAAKPELYDACDVQPGTSSTTIPSGQVNYDDSGGNPPPTGNQTPITNGLSGVQQKNPFIEFSEVISYELDNKIKVFYPKVLGAPPVFQQTSNPSLKIIQAGYFKQVAKQSLDVAPPNKPVLDKNATVLNFFVSPAVPDPSPDGSWNIYTVHWRYVLEFKKNLDDAKLTSAELVFPTDPRRPTNYGAGGNGGSLPELPNVAIIPS